MSTSITITLKQVAKKIASMRYSAYMGGGMDYMHAGAEIQFYFADLFGLSGTEMEALVKEEFSAKFPK